jgi:hypothetical protein
MTSKVAVPFICLFLVSAVGWAQEGPNSFVKPISAVKFAQDSDVKCLSFANESADPNTGPSTHILQLPQGCVVPWHYHTAEE